MTEISVAVRDLARFCFRSGDIDHRFTPSPSAVEGIAGHQALYRRRDPGYRPEYPVALDLARDGVSLRLRGRADGYHPQQGLLEEIKTCRCDFQAIPAAVSRLHLAQATLYAALICREEAREGLTVRLTWYNVDSGEEQPQERWLGAEELAGFLAGAMDRFARWLALLAARRERRDHSLAELSFPLGSFRPGQRDMAELVYKCIDQGGRLMLEAPTGIGKTAAVMYPALKALAADKHDRVVFLTAKTVGRRAAEDALARFVAAGYGGSALTLSAKERVCFSPGKACHGDDCPFARGYYDRLEQALEAALAEPALRREDIEALARRFEICPYQLGLDLLPWVDIVIADVHYAFSLTPTLGGLALRDGGRWSLLLDEAHNLPGRARGMYSASLAKADLMAARRGLPRALARPLERLNRQLLALQKEHWEEPQRDSRREVPAALQGALQGLVADLGEQLAAQPALFQQHPSLGEFYFSVLQFQRVLDQWGEEFRFELDRGRGPQGLRLALNCLDPARLLADRGAAFHSLTAFSATLSPALWMRQSLGLPEDTVCRRLDSPFAPEQLCVHIADRVDTRFRQRSHSLPDLAALLADWLGSNRDNVIVYFPSYRYLEDTLDLLRGRPDLSFRRCWVQARDQDDAGRQELLTLLARERGVAAFCILGGVFGEGIDLPGEQLASVAIVGVGLPQVNRDTEQLRQWYQQRYGAGFEYAYLYPGMQKVDQALGRVIRTPEDRGRALLIDSRYADRAYRQLLPRWWRYRDWRPTPGADD